MNHRIGAKTIAVSVVTTLLICGCSGNSETPSSSPPSVADRPANKPLRLLVVDDPPLADAIERQWLARVNSELQIKQTTSEKLFARRPGRLNVDAVIYPSAALGELVEWDLIDPLSSRVLDDSQLDRRDIFPLVRKHEIVWGERTYAIPLGSPPLLLIYRRDVFDQMQLSPPTSWAEYAAIAERLSKNSPLPVALAEPLAEGWAGKMLIARAAGYARHPNFFSTLFDLDSMAPLIAGPPFERALRELVAAARYGPEDADQLTPNEAWSRITGGQCAMVITWPRKTNSENVDAHGNQIGMTSLPASLDVFDPAAGEWRERDSAQSGNVAVLGIAGRLGSVTQSASNRQAAETLLIRIGCTEWSGDISPFSAATAPYRESQTAIAGQWMDSAPAEHLGDAYGEAVKQAFDRSSWLAIPRIPSGRQYMAALDQAVHAAIRGDQTPQQALDAAADQWREITTTVGVDSQRNALWRNWGFER